MNTVCKRCGKPCLSDTGNPEARLLKRSMEGYCADCAITQFLQNTEPINALIGTKGREMLLNPMVQEQIGVILKAGLSDCHIAEIDWQRVVNNWDMPFKRQS